jgi:hypothetical protein
MFSRIRKRLTYANVAMTLALVFAMTGGAYAANKYLITSTKQISPKVLASLKGKNGKNGTNGTPGATGPQGPTGPTGKDGAPGSEGKEGATGKEGPAGKEGPEGTEGKEGSPWTAGGTLPSGQTETGTYLISSPTGAGTEFGYALANISFPIPLLASIPKDHVVYVDGTVPSECENSTHAGTASPSNPEAGPGYLCVYRSSSANMNESEMEIFNPVNGANGASVAGAILFEEPTGAEAFADGTWAVTAA